MLSKVQNDSSQIERDLVFLMRKNYLHAAAFMGAFIGPMIFSIAISQIIKKFFPGINAYVENAIWISVYVFPFLYFLKSAENAVKRNQYAIYLVQFGVGREDAVQIAKDEQKQKSIGKKLTDLCEAYYRERESEINIYRDNLMKIIHEKYGEKRKGKFLSSWLSGIRSHQISLMHKQEPDPTKMAVKLRRYR